MKMEEDEDFDKFLIRIRREAYKCNFGDNKNESKEINILDKIIEVAPNEIKEKLLEKGYSLQEVISIYKITHANKIAVDVNVAHFELYEYSLCSETRSK